MNDIRISTATKEANLMKRIPTANCFFMKFHQPSSFHSQKFYQIKFLKLKFSTLVQKSVTIHQRNNASDQQDQLDVSEATQDLNGKTWKGSIGQDALTPRKSTTGFSITGPPCVEAASSAKCQQPRRLSNSSWSN